MIHILSRKKIYPLNPPLKTGLRFSRNAEVPSLASSPAMQMANALASMSQSGIQIRIHSDIDDFLGSSDRYFSPGCNGFGGFFHFIKKRFPSTHFVDHSVFLGFGGGDHIACKNHLLGLAVPINLARRWVPPKPGIIPSVISGKPSMAVSEA
jgi:hypothetical protein